MSRNKTRVIQSVKAQERHAGTGTVTGTGDRVGWKGKGGLKQAGPMGKKTPMKVLFLPSSKWLGTAMPALQPAPRNGRCETRFLLLPLVLSRFCFDQPII